MSIPSPYSWNPSTARDLSNLSRNNAQFSSTTEWGWTNAVGGHYFGTNPQLPSSYSRIQYNEERELAAKGYTHGTATAVGAFAVGAAATYGFWGSPIQDLARWTNNGVPKAVLEKTGFATATAWKDALGDNASKLFDKAGMYRGTSSPIARIASSSFSFWAGVNAAGSNFGHKLGEGLGRAAGTLVGQTARGIANLGGMVVGSGIDYIAGGMPSAVTGWISETGKELAESGAKSSAAYLKNFYKEAAESSLQKGFSILVPGAPQSVSALRAATPAAPGLFSMNTVYRAKGAIGKMMATNSFRAATRMAAGWAAGGAAYVGGAIGSMFLNPVSLATMYATDKGIQYAGDIYSNFKSVHEMEKAMVAKSDRILQFGAADNDRGIAGGFSAAQRARVVDTVQKMASQAASSGDMFGMGSNSIFGGHKAYTDRLKELKSILNVGTDMGMFDQLRSFEEFEKKFSQTVKMVDKMSKFIKKSKGEVMALMAGMQQEGVFDPTMAANKIARRDFAAKLTGVDIGTTMMESNAFSQMSNQAGFGFGFGGDRASENRIMLSRARRTGMMTRETEARLGGEQQILTDMFASDLAMLQDQKVMAGLSLAVRRDPVTGKVTFDRSALERDAEAANTYEGAREAGRKRAQHIWGMAYSDMLGARVEGGAFYDNSFNVKEAIATGVITSKDINRHLINMVQQRHMEMNPGGSTMGRREALTLGLMQFGGLSREQAAMKAAEYSGGFREQEMTENLAVNAERIRQDVENNAITGVGGNTAYLASKVAAHGYAATGAAIGAWFGLVPGAILGGGIGYIADKIFGEDTDEETARYYGYFAETGKERETREAARRRLKGASTEEIVSSMSVKEMKEILRYKNEMAPPPKEVVDESDELSRIESAMLAGNVMGQQMKSNSALREGMRISFGSATGYATDGTAMRYSLESLLNKEYEDADYSDVMELARRALAGEKINITEANADRFGKLMGAMRVEATLRAGGDKGKLDAFDRGFETINKNIEYGKDKVSAAEKAARDSRKHLLNKDAYEDAEGYVNPGYSLRALGNNHLGADMRKFLKSTKFTERTGKSLGQVMEGLNQAVAGLSNESSAILMKVLNGEILSAEEKKALHDSGELTGTELTPFVDSIRGHETGTVKMTDEQIAIAKKMLTQSRIAKEGRKFEALKSEISSGLDKKIAMARASRNEELAKYYESLKQNVNAAKDDVSAYNKLIDTFKNGSDKLKSEIGMSKEDTADMIAIAKEETVEFKKLSQSTQEKMLELAMVGRDPQDRDKVLKELDGHKVEFGGKHKQYGKEVAEDKLSEQALDALEETQEQTGPSGVKPGDAVAVTEKSIETLKEAAVVLRECARALRLMN